MEEIHLVCKKKHLNNGIIYQPQLVFPPDFFLSSINSTSLPVSLPKRNGQTIQLSSWSGYNDLDVRLPPTPNLAFRLKTRWQKQLSDSVTWRMGSPGLASVVIWSPVCLFQPFGKGTTGSIILGIFSHCLRDDPPRKSVPMGLPVAVGWKIRVTPKSPQSLS